MDNEPAARHWKVFNTSLLLIVVAFILGLRSASGSALQEGEWQIQVVDPGDDYSNDVGKYTSIALDPQGVPYISYYDIGNGDLKFAVLQPQEIGPQSTWSLETVDHKGYVGQYSSLAIDSAGLPHVSYYDDSNNDLKYAVRLDGGEWISDTLDSQGDVGRYTSIALDADNYPHISYYEAYPNYNLKHAYLDDNGWTTETLDSSGDVGQYSSLALDDEGSPHISYYFYDPVEQEKKLKYSYNDNGYWSSIDLPLNAGAIPLGSSSLALDRDRVPHIAFIQKTGEVSQTYELVYTYLDSGWHPEIVDQWVVTETWVETGGHVSLSLDRSGFPHIAYYDDAAGDLKYASLSSEGWSIEVVDAEGDVGSYPSIKLDRFGLPHLSYRDSTLDVYDLKYATLPFVLHETYLPLSLQDWVRYFTWFHELEDNDAAWQANGALIFGQEYIGYHNDEDDFYSLYLRAGSTMTIDLDTDHLEQDDSGYYVVQLMLYYGSPENRVARIYEPPYQIEYSGSAGWYYVRVYTAPEYLDGSKEYRLTANIP